MLAAAVVILLVGLVMESCSFEADLASRHPVDIFAGTGKQPFDLVPRQRETKFSKTFLLKDIDIMNDARNVETLGFVIRNSMKLFSGIADICVLMPTEMTMRINNYPRCYVIWRGFFPFELRRLDWIPSQDKNAATKDIISRRLPGVFEREIHPEWFTVPITDRYRAQEDIRAKLAPGSVASYPISPEGKTEGDDYGDRSRRAENYLPPRNDDDLLSRFRHRLLSGEVILLALSGFFSAALGAPGFFGVFNYSDWKRKIAGIAIFLLGLVAGIFYGWPITGYAIGMLCECCST